MDRGYCNNTSPHILTHKNTLSSWFFVFLFSFSLLFSVVWFSRSVDSATPPSIITYQGKLLEDGASVTTTKAMSFTIYDADSGGTALYTAAGTLPTIGTIMITPTAGIFSINLGDTDTNTLDPTIFSDNSELYLEIIVDGTTLSPRKRLTATPYAVNSSYLNGVEATSTPQSTTYIPMSDIDGSFAFNTTTFGGDVSFFDDAISFSTQKPSSNLSLLRVGNYATGDYGQLQVDGMFSIRNISDNIQVVKINDGGTFDDPDGVFLDIGSTNHHGVLRLMNDANIVTHFLSATSTFDSYFQGNILLGNAYQAPLSLVGFDMDGDDVYIDGTLGVLSTIFTDGEIVSHGTGTSTFAGSIDLASGNCFAVNGTCISGGSSQWTTTGSDIYYSDGNVGIGTDSPNAKLHLFGSGTGVVDDIIINEENNWLSNEYHGVAFLSGSTLVGRMGVGFPGSGSAARFVISDLFNSGEQDADIFAVDAGGIVSINDEQVVYLPDQTQFTGSLFIGNGGSSLSHTDPFEGQYNTVMGIDALVSNSTGYANSAFGANALYTNTTGTYNSAFGLSALYANTVGTNNSAFGVATLSQNTTGYGNAAFGSQSLVENTTGYGNSAFGYATLYTDTGIGNSVFGSGAVFNMQGSSSYNTVVGFNTGGGIQTGNYNTIIGAQVEGLDNVLSNNIIIADGEGNQRIRVLDTGYIGLNTTTPGYPLTVSGDSYFDGILNIAGTNTSTFAGSIEIASGCFSVAGVCLNPDGLWSLNGSDVYYTSGNVGVNTSSPVATFSVDGSMYVTNTTTLLGGYGLFSTVVVPNFAVFSMGSGLSGDLAGGMILQGNDTNKALFLMMSEAGAYATLGESADNWAMLTLGGAGVEKGGAISLTDTNSNINVRIESNDDIGTLLLSNSLFGDVIRFSSDVNEDSFVINDVLFGNSTSTLTNTSFVMDGDDVYIEDSLGVKGNIYTDGTIVMGNTQALYVPNQTQFTGSIIVGNGGQNLSHTVGLQGFYNTIVGVSAGTSLTTGLANTSVGYGSMASTTTGVANNAFGGLALAANTTGNYNVAVGSQSLFSNTSGSLNIGVGGQSLFSNTSGSTNIAVGLSALYSNTTGINNIAIGGANTLVSSTVGYNNIAIGVEAMYRNVSGFLNNAIGYGALDSNTTGSRNNAFGQSALGSIQTGEYNTAVGDGAGNGIDGSYNTFFGAVSASGVFDPSVSYNTVVGADISRANTSTPLLGSYNTIIGSQLSIDDGGFSNNIIIADGAGNQRIRVLDTGYVGINNTNPAYMLDVSIPTDGIVAAFTDTDATCTVDPSDGDFSCTSDRNLKTNITVMGSTLDAVMQLNPVTYNWNTDPSGEVNYGFIAQEVEALFPRLVGTGANGYKTLSQIGLIPFLTKAIQEQQLQINTLSSALLQGSGADLTNGSFEGTLRVAKHVTFGEDTVGQIKLLSGATSVRVTFADLYEHQPIVTVSPLAFISGQYRVTEENEEGFTLELSESQPGDVVFNWHAFAGEGAKLTVSDGSFADITLVVVDQGEDLSDEEQSVEENQEIGGGGEPMEPSPEETLLGEEGAPEEPVVFGSQLGEEVASEPPVQEENTFVEVAPESVVGEGIGDEPAL